jgi:hypothetical protein
VFFDGTRVNLPPAVRLGQPHRQCAAELRVSGLAERQQDAGRGHLADEGRRPAHDEGGLLQQPQLQGAERRAPAAVVLFQGNINFGNSTNNPLDTGFGFANAATGVFTSYSQASKLVEGNMIYNNTEFYIQDNWKVTNRLTMDYGMRFTRQQPQHDQFQQMSNFFPEQWSASAAPLLYVAGCSNGARPARATTRTRCTRSRARF